MTPPDGRAAPKGRLLKRLLAAPFVLVAVVIILIEDWLWDDLARLAAAIGRLPVFRRIEALVAGLPPYAALALFMAPTVLLVPVKLAALYFIAHGRPTLGLLTVAAAKVVGTALVARLFTLTRPALLRIAWFAWLYTRFLAFKARIYEVIRSTALYRAAHALGRRARAALTGWLSTRRGSWRRRWDATRRFLR
jgi:hypothetical protein